MPEPRGYGAAAPVGDSVLLMGGGTGKKWFNTCLKYDYKDDAWFAVRYSSFWHQMLWHQSLDFSYHPLNTEAWHHVCWFVAFVSLKFQNYHNSSLVLFLVNVSLPCTQNKIKQYPCGPVEIIVGMASRNLRCLCFCHQSINDPAWAASLFSDSHYWQLWSMWCIWSSFKLIQQADNFICN